MAAPSCPRCCAGSGAIIPSSRAIRPSPPLDCLAKRSALFGIAFCAAFLFLVLMQRMLLRVAGTVAGLAMFTAVLLIALRLVDLVQPALVPWTFKSAYPLILVGLAFAGLQFAVPRNRTQKALGLIVSAAFILWGSEQFLSNPRLISSIDDLVVFFFVLDLSIVIFGNLKPRKHAAGEELPLDTPDD